MNNYGKNVKEYRKENNLKQEELAEKLGISSNMLGKIERGERKPNKEVQSKFYVISGIKFEDEIQKDISSKLEQYLLDYLTNQDFSKDVIVEIIKYFSKLNDEKNINNILNKIMRNDYEKDVIELYVRNILLILNDFYYYYQKQCNVLYKNVSIFIIDNLDDVIDLLSRIESSIFINSKIPLYKSISIDTHTKTDEYLTSFQTNKYRFAYIIQDNLMYPKFEKGNIVVVLEDSKYSNSDDVVISINNETPIIRKIMFKDNLIILQTYNNTYKTEIYSKDEVKILGKIIETRYVN